MRKINLNFNQQKSFPAIIAVLMIFLLSACQKEKMQDFERLDKTSLQESIIDENTTPTGDITINLEFNPKETNESANSRSAIYLMYSGTFSVSQSNWTNLYYTHLQLPDPNVWRVEVEIRPISGNPNLYIYGYDEDIAYPWRYVRGSSNAGMANDKTSFRETGMKGSEERMYMSVYGATAARYELFIYAVTVDCEEYPTADQWVTLEYMPVCGCNGTEYPNPSSARVAGITSWTNGSCNSINGFWINTDAATRGITKMSISNNSQTIRVYGSCSPTDCDWGDAVLTKSGDCYNTTYEHGFATRTVKLHKQSSGLLKMTIFNDYHDSRTDRTDVYYFTKAD